MFVPYTTALEKWQNATRYVKLSRGTSLTVREVNYPPRGQEFWSFTAKSDPASKRRLEGALVELPNRFHGRSSVSWSRESTDRLEKASDSSQIPWPWRISFGAHVSRDGIPWNVRKRGGNCRLQQMSGNFGVARFGERSTFREFQSAGPAPELSTNTFDRPVVKPSRGSPSISPSTVVERTISGSFVIGLDHCTETIRLWVCREFTQLHSRQNDTSPVSRSLGLDELKPIDEA